MHRVLKVPEIMTTVFYHDLDSKSLRSAALTCTVWTDVSLDSLWRDLPSLYPAVRILGPMKKGSDSDERGWEFSVLCISEKDWDRFSRYANRVHTLTISSLPAKWHLLPSVYTTIAHFRPTTDLFPNLRSIAYQTDRGGIDAMAPLIITSGTRVRQLQFTPARDIPSSFDCIIARLPHLQRLQITTSVPDLSLVKLMNGLEELESLTCRTTEVTQTLLSAAVGHGALSTLVVDSLWGGTTKHVYFPCGVPSRLVKLSLHMSIEKWLELMEQDVPPSLRTLEIEAGSRQVGYQYIRQLFDDIAEAAPDLEHLKFTYHSRNTGDGALRMASLGPLARCRQLRSVSVRHRFGVDISRDELQNLLRAWPGLTKLELSYTLRPVTLDWVPGKIPWSAPSLPLSALDVFAAECPQIRELALCVDADIITPDYHVRPALRHLESFDITLSTISNPFPVAKYLARTIATRALPAWQETCQPVSGDDARAAVKAAEPLWKRTRDLLELLHSERDRMDAKWSDDLRRANARVEALEQELALLRPKPIPMKKRR